MQEKLRLIPSVDILLKTEAIQTLLSLYPRQEVTQGIRQGMDFIREEILDEKEVGNKEEITRTILEKAEEWVTERNSPSLKKVINATGVIIHTNLGRASLPEKAVERAMEAGRGYSNLEYDLSTGKRGKRISHLKKYLTDLTGAEDAIAVNNNAAALMLILDTFAQGREVIVSRGELIELGGSFRLPDVLKKSGAILKEVGCTNKTHPHDYESAINEKTSILLKIHQSNYRIVGFTKETTGSEVVKIAHSHGIMAVEDMGSGLFMDLSRYGLKGEPTVQESIQAGLDLVCFSGDKLLGGPQAGIIVGKTVFIQKLAKNPLMRALRLDKMTIGALEGTLSLYRDMDNIEKNIPVLRMLSLSPQEIRKRAESLIKRLEERQSRTATEEGMKKIGDEEGLSRTETEEGIKEIGHEEGQGEIKGKPFVLLPESSRIGGGSFPDTPIPTFLIAYRPPHGNPEEIYMKLLKTDPPIISRIVENYVCLDLRTVFPHEEEELLRGIREIL